MHQTGWDVEPLTAETWRGVARRRLQAVDWQQVVADVRPFLEPVVDPAILGPENLNQLLD